jgi:CDGSH-type Zn-finger protein
MESRIKIVKNGPYAVSGVPMKKEIIVPDKEGWPLKWKDGEKYPGKDHSLCRCGHSCTKPFCDSSHIRTKFDGTEVASRENYIDQAERVVGPKMDLTDARDLCAGAKFCDRLGGTWKLTAESGNEESRKLAVEQACNCPSGRLVAWDKHGKEIEPKFEKSISITEFPGDGVSGPIWVKGKVEIESADGKLYEKRNRVTLCRCGKSQNKPFCDGSHVEGFSDGDASLD